MAREINWKALCKQADPKPEPAYVAYNFAKPKVQMPRAPNTPYAGPVGSNPSVLPDHE